MLGYFLGLPQQLALRWGRGGGIGAVDTIVFIMMDYLTFSVRCVLQCTLYSVHIVHVCMSSGFLDSTLGHHESEGVLMVTNQSTCSS